MYKEITDAIEALKTLIKEQGEQLNDIQRELQLTRKGHEASTWGEEVEEMEDVEMDDVLPKENDE